MSYYKTLSSKSFAVLLLNLSFIAFLISGCGGPPSEGLADTKLDELIEERSDGNIELVDLQKNDGQMREENGAQKYEMDIRGSIEILTICYWRPRRSFAAGNQFTTTTDMPENSLEKINPKYSGIKSEAGEQYQLKGSITFEQKESGWNISQTDLKVNQ